MTGTIYYNGAQVATIDLWPTEVGDSVVFRGDYGTIKIWNSSYSHTSSGDPYYSIQARLFTTKNISKEVATVRTSYGPSGEIRKTTYAYLSAVVEQPRATGSNWRYTLDSTIRLTSTSQPSGELVWHDNNGNPALVRDSQGRLVRDA